MNNLYYAGSVVNNNASAGKAVYETIDKNHVITPGELTARKITPERSYDLLNDEEGKLSAYMIDDISETINEKIAIGIVLGAPGKTLPKIISSGTRRLCKKLYFQCEDKRKIKNMDNLFIYVQPEKGIKKAIVIGKYSAKIIKCHSKSGAHVPIPSMLVEMATNGG